MAKAIAANSQAIYFKAWNSFEAVAAQIRASIPIPSSHRKP